MEIATKIVDAILNNIMVPVIIALGAAIIFVLKNKFDKVSKSIVAKNELSDLEKKNNVRRDLIKTIDEQVEAAVVANMQLADQMKEAGQALTPEQAKQLNDNAKAMVMNALPPSLTTDDGVLLEMIGGRERLDSIINTMMEKHVYDYKLKKMQISNSQNPKKISNVNQIPTRSRK